MLSFVQSQTIQIHDTLVCVIECQAQTNCLVRVCVHFSKHTKTVWRINPCMYVLCLSLLREDTRIIVFILFNNHILCTTNVFELLKACFRIPTTQKTHSVKEHNHRSKKCLTLFQIVPLWRRTVHEHSKCSHVSLLVE